MLVFVLTIIVIVAGLIGAVATVILASVQAPDQYREAKKGLESWKANRAPKKQKYYYRRRK